MSTIYTNAAAGFVLPVGAVLAAAAAAFVAFMGRRQSVAMATVAHTTDLVTATGWSSPSVKRPTTATSHAPQSRGSTG